jgi:ATP-dependent helicase/nuclease subunit A
MAWLRAAETEIKRDMEITRDEVRVMTVHGAKGLEAPLVILADTTSRPTGPRSPRLIALPAVRAAPGAADRFVWAGRKATDTAAVTAGRQQALDEAKHEYRRLLYVAMTRAADRLIVCGCEGVQKPPEGCWYDLVFRGLSEREGFGAVGEGEAQIWRYRKVADSGGVRAVAPVAEPAASPALPAWLRQDAPAEAVAALAVTPSESDEAMANGAPAGSGEPRRIALARGVLIHRLMQSLPDIAPERRAEAARRFLARASAGFAQAERDALAAKILQVLADGRFAALFGPGSRAEVPIVGRLTRGGKTALAVSGQIDRLAVSATEVLIADYKSNRPAPRTHSEVPPAYVRQLALYRAVLQKLYPDRPVRAVLVWTDIPDLMELSADALDRAVAQRLA